MYYKEIMKNSCSLLISVKVSVTYRKMTYNNGHDYFKFRIKLKQCGEQKKQTNLRMKKKEGEEEGEEAEERSK